MVGSAKKYFHLNIQTKFIFPIAISTPSDPNIPFSYKLYAAFIRYIYLKFVGYSEHKSQLEIVWGTSKSRRERFFVLYEF